MADEKRLQPSMRPADVRRPPARRGRSEGLTARAQVEMENGDVIDVYFEAEQLRLKVVDSNGNEVFFKVRRSGDAGGRGALAVAGPDRFRSPPADEEDCHPQEADERLREWAGRPGAEHGWEWTDLTDPRRPLPLQCDRQGVDPGTMVFLYDGDRVQPEHTPEQLGMEDGDEIDA